MAESIEELREKLIKWKRAMEMKGMRVNVDKTKMMWEESDLAKDYGVKYPCTVCYRELDEIQ